MRAAMMTDILATKARQVSLAYDRNKRLGRT
jgi:hypothetical protein